MRSFHTAAVVALILSVLVASAGAEVVWTGPPAGAAAPPAPAADCWLGNGITPPAWEADAVDGVYEFAYLIDPADFNCCDQGYAPESVKFWLQYAFEDMASSLIFSGVLTAESGPDGLLPGAEICVTPPGWILNADIPGVYPITIPAYDTGGVYDLDCPCLDSGSPFFVFARIQTDPAPGNEPDAGRDEAPVGGKTFVRQDGGAWQDVTADLGWGGELVMRTDVVCCNEPVDVDPATWGRVKALYR